MRQDKDEAVPANASYLKEGRGVSWSEEGSYKNPVSHWTPVRGKGRRKLTNPARPFLGGEGATKNGPG